MLIGQARDGELAEAPPQQQVAGTGIGSGSSNSVPVKPDKHFDSDGVRINYIDVGDRIGEPVWLIHGLLGNSTMWTNAGSQLSPNIPEALVSNGFRVIVVDLRGHGLSDKPL
jgi:hypothetical protein